MNPTKTTLQEFRHLNEHHGTFYNEDLVTLFVPLFKQLTKIYDENKVANIRNPENIWVENREISFNHEKVTSPDLQLSTIEKINRKRTGIFEVTERNILESNIGDGRSDFKTAELRTDDSEIIRPCFVLGYKSYEQELDHYDQKTELFICGLYMASFAFGLDFNNKKDVERFIAHRDKLYFLNRDLHPTLLLIISQLTQLDRDKRTRETRNLVWKLENYKDYSVDYEVDILESEGFIQSKNTTRNQWVLNHLKGRLFDISRRNKLLFFKNSSKFLNLTIASVPTVLYYENVKEKDLFLWHSKISDQVKEEGKINLGSYLKFDETGYISSKLDNIRSIARKDLYEYGFSQLKMVIAFLNWYNFKENKTEKINSPLLIVPVKLVKKTGVKDKYILHFTSSQAEINPVLAHYLKELYDIDLPEFIDLEKVTITSFYEKLQQIIAAKSQDIELILNDKPKIKLIQSIAKQRITQYNKRTRYVTTEFNISSYHYSYKRENYSPLGVKIFNDRIKPHAEFLEYLINDDIEVKPDAFADKTRRVFEIDKDGETNPYRWEFDLCNMTLGNFNYKKMSLVRDYNLILNQGEENQVFNYLFSDEPKKLADPNESLIPYEENFYVLNADATQAKAISKAKSGESIIIQGPPGTGKSQTITNLIADYAFRGKKILFVCEKRAALDVVYSRLKQNNLHYLASLVHDSQEDKKAFIMDAKVTYEKFVNETDKFHKLERKRDSKINQIRQELQSIRKFHELLQATYPVIGMQLITFIEELIELNENITPKEIHVNHELDYSIWKNSFEVLQDFSQVLQSIGKSENMGNYPLIGIDKTLINNEQAFDKINKTIHEISTKIDEWQELAELYDLENELKFNLTKLQTYAQVSQLMYQLKVAGQTAVFDTNSENHKQLNVIYDQMVQLKYDWENALEKNKHWRKKFSPIETETILDKMQKLEGKFYAFLIPSFHKYKKLLQQSYDFGQHRIKPKMTLLLKQLKEEQSIENQYNEINAKVEKQYNTSNFIEIKQHIDKLLQNQSNVTSELKNYSQDSLKTLSEMRDEINSFIHNANSLGSDSHKNTVQDVDVLIQKIEENLNTLPVVLPYLRSFSQLDKKVKTHIQSNGNSLEENELAIAQHALKKLYQENINIVNATGYSLTYSVEKIHRLHQEILDLNGDYLLEKFKYQFKKHLHNSTLTAAQQTPEEKIQKKEFNKARRILENEFNKKIRYKSIRDLKSLESDYILNMLKPIWLMSPLSVSDTLPVDSNAFDVVIFDEASQITLEEGIPTLFRSNQAIIVGDEMQMPPTNFFGSTNNIQEELDEDESEKVVIDADSMLTHATKKLEDIMLSWHYRSKYENLIGFSNAAFYDGELLTIPDREIKFEETNQDDTISNRISNEIISFHFQEDGVYNNRQNNVEANYIADMVYQILKNQPDMSIGVVAFSKQQQDNIERALSKLAAEDKVFAQLLEEAYVREEDDQHVGLFVKNLENVQGDERDIIIISVCYGYNEKGRMLMNFGPINRKGGEKRLNVIFSRAKKHMAIVSSIKFFDIKNEYNQGANYLRRFLEYAEHVSNGNQKNAESVLLNLSPHKSENQPITDTDIVVKQIENYITSLGYETTANVGLSDFKIAIGVKDKDNPNVYTLGIMLDSTQSYQSENVLDQYVLRPNLLSAFGWKNMKIYKKDWLEKPELVKEQIKNALEGKKLIEKEDVPLTETEVETEVITEEKPIVQETTVMPEDNARIDEVYLEFKDENSSKFWKVEQDKLNLIITFGRIGNDGRQVVKSYESEFKAELEKEKLIASKLKKGYQKTAQ